MINRMKLQFAVISCSVLYFVVSKMMGFGSKTTTVTKSADRGNESYESLTSLFSRMKHPPKEIKRALKKIASNQATLKSMDGVAHQFKHALGDSTSLSKRLKTFLKSKKKSLKEASKILEYTSTIERSLQACEIIHAVSLTPIEKELKLNQNVNTVRDKAIRNTELMELHHWDMQHGNLKWKVSLLVPINVTLSQPAFSSTTSSLSEKQKSTNKKIEKDDMTELSKYDSNELIIVISDVKMYQQSSYTDKQYQKFEKNVVYLLKLMNDKEADYLPLKSSGLVEEDIAIHKTILTLAIQTILKIYPYVLAYNEEQDSFSNTTLLNNNSTRITTTNIDVDDFDDSSNSDSDDNSDKMNNTITNNTSLSSTSIITTTTTRHLKYSSIRVLGYSLGASIGSYIAMILDGSLNVTFPEYVFASDDKEDNLHSSIKEDIFSDSHSDTSSNSDFKGRKLIITTVTSDNSDDDNANDNNDSDRKSVKNKKASKLKLKKKTKKKSKRNSRSRKPARSVVDEVDNNVFESNNEDDNNNSDNANNDNHDNHEVDNSSISEPTNTDTNANTYIDSQQQNATIATTSITTSINDKKETIKSLIGLYTKKVQCICISPVPCISRAIIPQYISSVICGDDIVPRATPQTIQKLKKRLLEALKSGAGKSSISWNLGGAWLSDVKFLAGNSINQYASGTHDTSSLTVPGRVFYVKKRSLNKGGSIQRVFRGNWREDMLWLLHEVLLSSKMMSHHDLIYCAQVLARV